jgi:cysteinyl-tRNA synthetase, unknown class
MKLKSIDDAISNPRRGQKLFACIALGAALFLGQCSMSSANIPRKYESWHYQLQNAKYSNLKALGVEALVIDFEDALLTKSDITAIQNDKDIFSYLCVGAAESYRDYWGTDWRVGNPSFVDEELPDWPGNYFVKYWDPDWQDIMRAKVQQIVDLGYNGIYLDMIDGYYHYEELGRATAAQEMIAFVEELRNLAKATNPDFLIIPQNAPELYEHSDFKTIIDGFGKEDTWYFDNSKRSSADINYELYFLDLAVKDGKFVLAIDYPTNKRYKSDFYRKCAAYGFTATVSNRALNLDKPVK